MRGQERRSPHPGEREPGLAAEHDVGPGAELVDRPAAELDARPAGELEDPVAAELDARPAAEQPRLSLYSRLLRLRHVQLRPWHRAVLAEGSIAVAVLLTMADLATAWTLLVLPLAVAALVKLHDVVAGLIDPHDA